MPTAHFAFTISMPQTIVLVYRPKKNDTYLAIQATVLLAKFPGGSAITKEMSEKMIGEIATELARANMQWEITGNPLQDVAIIHSVPITDRLTQDEFITALWKINSARLLASHIIQKELGIPGAIPAKQ